jgi:hypothetical protein
MQNKLELVILLYVMPNIITFMMFGVTKQAVELILTQFNLTSKYPIVLHAKTRSNTQKKKALRLVMQP